jgi:hypothetical protein
MLNPAEEKMPAPEVPQGTPRQRAREIVARICEPYGLTPEDIGFGRKKRGRDRVQVFLRMHSLRAIREVWPSWSTPQLGRLFHMDHTTVLYLLGKTSKTLHVERFSSEQIKSFLTEQRERRIRQQRLIGWREAMKRARIEHISQLPPSTIGASSELNQRIAKLMGEGLSDRQIAVELGMWPTYVDHVRGRCRRIRNMKARQP